MDYKNAEGYADPTPYEAIRRIAREEKKFRPLVYSCAPFAGDVETNAERTRRFCRYAVDSGRIPLAPHLMFPQFMDDDKPKERALALFMDTVLMSKCRELWVLADVITAGMRLEIDTAERRGQSIRYFNDWNGRYEEVRMT